MKIRKQPFDDMALNYEAKNVLIKKAQTDVMKTQIEKWNLRKDTHQLYRVHVRLDKAFYWIPLLYLINNSRLIHLLILKDYEQNLHIEVSHHTLRSLREHYWFEKRRKTVQKS